MSRVGKLPIEIPSGVEVKQSGRLVSVKGPKGQLEQAIPEGVEVSIEGSTVTVKRQDDEKSSRSLHGLTRTLVYNMVHGVSQGFTKSLQIVGVGYRAALKENNLLELSLGHSHPVSYDLPEGIKVELAEKNTLITLTGCDKNLLGHVAAKIRSFRKPEPYKGKGVKYTDEHIRRKAGKAAASGSK